MKKLIKLSLILLVMLSLTATLAMATLDEGGDSVTDMMDAIEADAILAAYKQGETVTLADDGYIGIPVEITTYYDAAKPTKSGYDVDATNLVLYVINASFERIGTDSDVDIIKSMLERGYIVTVVDYKNNEQAVSPDLDFSLQAVRNVLKTGKYFTDSIVFASGTYYNSFVVPSGYDVSPYRVFWEIDKHATDGTLDKIVEYWNNDFRAWTKNKDIVIPWVDGDGNRKATQTAHDGTEPVWLNADGTENADGAYIKIKHTLALDVTDCVKKDGSPIDLNLYMHLVYPTGSAEVPVLTLVGSSEHIANGTSPADRPQFIGAPLRGYAAVTFDHGWTPMARADHYGYFDGSTSASGSVTGNNTTYSIQFYNEVEIATAAMRYIRYLSLSSEQFNFKLDAIGAYGNSKGGWMQFLGAEDPYTVSGERRVYIGHHGETRYDNGDTETVGIIDGGEPQPWLTYGGEEIDGGADFVYCSCGGTSESILPGHAPVFISCQLDDGSCWGSSREFIQACRTLDIPAMWVEVSLGHTFASGPDTKFGIKDTYSTFFNFLGYWLMDDAVSVEYIYADVSYGGMPTYAPFTVKFTGPVSESEISKITLVGGGVTANGRWESAFGNTEWTFYPDYLKSNTEYVLTVPAGVTAANGKATESARTYSMTTGYESADTLTRVAGTRGTYVTLTVPDAANITEFNVNNYLLRVKVANDAVNKLGIYTVSGYSSIDPDASAVGELLGSLAVNGEGYYELDLTEYMSALTVGEEVTLLIKCEKTVAEATVFSYDGVGDRPAGLDVSGTVESSVTTLDGNGVIEIGKTQPTATYPLDPFYNNLSYNTVINCTTIIKSGKLTYDDTGRRFTVSFRVYDTTSRNLQIDVKDASLRSAGILDYDGIIYNVTTKANEWVDVSLTVDIYDPAVFGEYGLITKSVAIKTYGFGEEVHPIYFDDFKSVETVTDVILADVALVSSTTEQRQNPLETPYGTIPSQYESVDDYPFVVFDSNGKFIRATDIWATDTGTGALGSAQQQSYVNLVILLRRDYHYTDAAAYNNFAFCYGDIKIDLGDNKLYVEQGHTEGLFYCHAKRSPRTDVVIENGEIVFGGGELITIGSWDTSGYDYANEVKQFNFTFNGVTFSHSESSVSSGALFTNAASGAAVPVISNLIFNECVFDFENNLPADYTVLTLGSSNDNALAYVTVKGGVIKGASLSDLTFYKKLGTSSTFDFEKGTDNKYLVQKIKGEGEPASLSVAIDGTNYSYAASGTDGEYTVYSVAKNPLETPYGMIDSAYADADKYPFALFKDNGDGTYTFVMCEESVFQDASAIMLKLREYGGVVYMRQSYTAERGFNNANWIKYGMYFDLGGNTLTAYTEGTTYPAAIKKAWGTDMTFANGEIVLGAKSFINTYVSAADGTGMYLNVTFKDVDFVYSEGAYASPVVYNNDSNQRAFSSSLVYENCTFDLTNAGGTTLFHTGYDYIDVDITVKGGKVILGSSELIMTQITAIGTVELTEGDDGYLTVEAPAGSTAPTGTFTYGGNEGAMVYARTEGGKDIYVVGEPHVDIVTQYGTIPAEYSNAARYPFVVFKADGSFYGAYPCLFGSTDTANGGDLSIIAMHGARYAGDGAVILMRTDWTYTYSVSYPNIGNNTGSVTLDLGGFTIYDKHTYSGGLFVLMAKLSTPNGENTLVVKNGTILVGGKNPVVSFGEFNSAVDGVTLNIDFEKVDFGYLEGATVNALLTSTANPTLDLYWNLSLTDCTVDLVTNAPAGAKLLASGGKAGAVTVTANGLTFVGNNNNFDSASFIPKHSVTLYFDFVYNVYIPATSGILSITLGGEKYTDVGALDVVFIDGIAYYRLEKRVNPFGAYDSLLLTVELTLSDGRVATGEWSIGVVSYVCELVSDTDAVTSALASDMLAYIAAAYNFFAPDSAEAVAVTELANELLGADYNATHMPSTDVEIKQSTDGLSSAALMLDSTPAFVFYPATDTEGNLLYSADKYKFTVGGVSVSGEAMTDGDGRTYIAVKLYAYRMTETVCYTVAGTDIAGEFNLKAYLEFAEGESDALVTLVLRLWKYSESAAEYKTANS